MKRRAFLLTPLALISVPAAAVAPTRRPYVDVIHLMLRQAEWARHDATGIVFHPTDWVNIKT